MRTPDAMTALLKLAYTPVTNATSVAMARAAAHEYVYVLRDKALARSLLVAEDSEVIATGLVALIGQPIDAELLAKLAELAVSESGLVRNDVAFVLRRDTNVSFSKQKAKILLQSMESILQCGDSTNLLGVVDDVVDAKQTRAEFALSIQASALGTLTNLPSTFWGAQSLPAQGLAREFMVLGQVKAGNGALREEARSILKGSASLRARLFALHTLMWTPTKEDIEAVRWVAEHDSLKTGATSQYFNMPSSDQSLRDKRDPQVYMMRFLAAHELRLKGL